MMPADETDDERTVKLRKAAWIIRMALRRNGLSLSDLDPADGQLCSCRQCSPDE